MVVSNKKFTEFRREEKDKTAKQKGEQKHPIFEQNASSE